MNKPTIFSTRITKDYVLLGLIEEGWVELAKMKVPIEDVPVFEGSFDTVLTDLVSNANDGEYSLVGNCIIHLPAFKAYKIGEVE